MWLLLALLLTGAASYTHGSRYAIVPGHDTFQLVGMQDAGSTPPLADTAAGSGDTSPAVFKAVRAVHEAGGSVDPETLEKDCCERRQAPRGEPAPLKTGVVDPPSLTHRQSGDGILSSLVPPEPDLPALTVVKLSISRT